MNELFHALQSMGARQDPVMDQSNLAGVCATGHAGRPQPKPIDLDWRGKSVRLLTPDEVVEFANAMHREVDRLREERDEYLGRAIAAENRHE